MTDDRGDNNDDSGGDDAYDDDLIMVMIILEMMTMVLMLLRAFVPRADWLTRHSQLQRNKCVHSLPTARL